MRILLNIIRVYSWLVIAWAIMTWIPGLGGSTFHYYLGLPIVPLLNLFSFAHIGFIGLQAMILIGILLIIEFWLEKKIKEQESGGFQRPEPPVDENRD